MTPGFARFILKTFGWTTFGEKAEEKNCIYLEAPHTSIWDFLIGYLYYRSKGGKLRIMIKREMFIFPLGPLLKSLGGFSIDRKNPQQTILHIIREMENPESKPFHLAICPEGTRKKVTRWKTGYHTIARKTGLPVYLTVIDWKKKEVGIFHKFGDITDDARSDTDRIQALFEELHPIGKHPERFAAR